MAITAPEPGTRRVLSRIGRKARRSPGTRALSPEPWSARLRALWYRVRDLSFSTPLYRPFLSGPSPRTLLCLPPDPWPGTAERGAAIVAGRFAVAGETLAFDRRSLDLLWAGATGRAGTDLHGFGWLADLRAAGGDQARRRARDLVASWIGTHRNWRPLAWRADVLGQRLTAWISHYEFFCASADETFRAAVFESLGRQARHLARVAGGAPVGVPALRAVKGLLYAGLCLEPGRGGGVDRLGQALRLLHRELGRQIRDDGGHVCRSPSLQLEAMRHLIDMRGALAAAGQDIPEALQEGIGALAATLRRQRHGDGGLALFNGGHEEHAWVVDMALAQAGGRGRWTAAAAESGFARLTVGRLVVILDAGAPPPPPYDAEAHAGTLSMEVGVGKERLIVNCGASEVPSWRDAMRSTAAHSTVVVADTNSSELLGAGGLGRRARVPRVTREESDGNIWLSGSHDGYVARFGVVHRRRLYLAADGTDLRGEDALQGGGAGHEFALRFHLHPGVTAQMLQGGSACLLRLPGGSGWRFRVGTGGALSLEDSVYMGEAAELRRSQQLVVRGTVQSGGSILKWALQRESRR